ncbi:hypothetical protein DRB06_00005 [Actinomyces sp. Z5]|uniref:hypothetical protein n=1 Tax=Actinomyces sp. Z5 TaxID=2250216 RepID=UPI000DCC5EE1|nr:hypothetical protein [Actinomyces sp. Z5]RAX24741.1 hypothetical protein DRB06_00005 [Actinomyces sp. Z5]
MSFVDVLASETRKALTLPSLRLTVTLTILLMASYCALDARGARSALLSGQDAMGPQELGVYALANLAFLPVIAAVLIASSEHAGGQLTDSILAVPRRHLLVLAKLTLAAMLIFAEAALLSIMILAFYQGGLGSISVFASGQGTHYLASLAMGTAYWTLLGLFSTSVAMVVRSQTTVLAVMILLTGAGMAFLMINKVFQYLPTNAGLMMFIGDQTEDLANPPDLEPTPATAVVVAWVLVAIATALVAIKRRDVGARQVTPQ